MRGARMKPFRTADKYWARLSRIFRRGGPKAKKAAAVAGTARTLPDTTRCYAETAS
jgi:hypothetical protein